MINVFHRKKPTWSVFTVWFSSDVGEWVGDKPRISDKDVAWSKSKLFKDKVDDMAGTASSCRLAILESLKCPQNSRGQSAFSENANFSKYPEFRLPALLPEKRAILRLFIYLVPTSVISQYIPWFETLNSSICFQKKPNCRKRLVKLIW